ncbi:MAG: 50S ribosomal protein L24 [Candidatus Portiera sp.]|nr:50S ribosomal protein L24 [Portiera sp.]
MKRIKRSDEVMVLTGKDKGKRGTVQRVLTNGKIVIGGINMVKKHQKPNPNLNIPGGIIDKEMPLDISNVAIFNKEANKKDKVGFMLDEKKGKIRVYKSTQKEIS